MRYLLVSKKKWYRLLKKKDKYNLEYNIPNYVKSRFRSFFLFD